MSPLDRSDKAEDYQRLRQRVGALMKQCPDGHEIAPHAHERDQLLYCVTGVMRLRTDEAALIVPPDRAVYIPAGLRHAVRMHGAVEMRTLYIAPPAGHAAGLRVLGVSRLLRELIVALCDEPMEYDEDGRGGLISRLIEAEIERAGELALSVPLPRDPRLQRLCAALLAEPSDSRTLEAWSEDVGASARTLARLFESEIGMGFREWRLRIRLHVALEALSRGDAIEQVARTVGYRSASAFAAAFRQATGAAPSQIRSAPSGMAR